MDKVIILMIASDKPTIFHINKGTEKNGIPDMVQSWNEVYKFLLAYIL